MTVKCPTNGRPSYKRFAGAQRMVMGFLKKHPEYRLRKERLPETKEATEFVRELNR